MCYRIMVSDFSTKEGVKLWDYYMEDGVVFETTSMSAVNAKMVDVCEKYADDDIRIVQLVRTTMTLKLGGNVISSEVQEN